MDSLKKPFLNPNKHLKEQFVSNLTGSSMLEIAALSTIVPALIVLRQWSRFCQVNEVKLKKDDNVATCQKFWRNYVVSLAVDFLFIFLPILSVFTVLADWVYICAICLTLLLLFCLLAKRFRSSSFHSKGAEGELSSLRTNILSYRVSMMVVTCVCILAVDFKIFPRRYAKTETYGTGLMDLGVGSFVVANSLVSRQTRDAISTKWKAVLQSTSPLLLLGTGRLISTTGIDYQVHVGEYGVHWNFFFTLAAVSILTTTINIHPQFCGIFGSVVLIGYQICLKCGLNEYLLSNERALNFISSNKEGLFSIFGYWGMYLVGVHLGYHLFFGSQSGTKMRSVQWAKIRVWFLAILFWSLAIVLDKGVEKVSRRMCNLAYVSLVFAQNFQVLSILMFSDFIPGKRPLVLEEVFNQNLLGSFLLANLLTGMVNLNMDTLSASSPASFSILLGYSIVLTALVGFAGLCGVKLKFW